MTAEFILHIGTEKTGTSTIQSALKQNSDWLKERGIWLPQTLRPQGDGDNQIILPAIFCEGQEKESILERAGKPADWTTSQFSSHTREELAIEVSSLMTQGVNTFLVSSEHLSTRLRSVAEIKALKDWLEPIGKVKQIVVYLRRQDLYLASSYSTDLKSGRTKPFNIPNPKWAHHRYDYKNLLQLWGKVFGEHLLTARPFEKNRFLQNNLLVDFLGILNINETIPIQPDAINPSLDTNALAALLGFNLWIDQRQSKPTQKVRERFVRFLESTNSSDRMTLSAQQANDFLARYTEQNNWVTENFIADGLPLFSEQIDSTQKENLPTATPADALYEILSKILLTENSPNESQTLPLNYQPRLSWLHEILASSNKIIRKIKS